MRLLRSRGRHLSGMCPGNGSALSCDGESKALPGVMGTNPNFERPSVSRHGGVNARSRLRKYPNRPNLDFPAFHKQTAIIAAVRPRRSRRRLTKGTALPDSLPRIAGPLIEARILEAAHPRLHACERRDSGAEEPKRLPLCLPDSTKTPSPTSPWRYERPQSTLLFTAMPTILRSTSRRIVEI